MSDIKVRVGQQNAVKIISSISGSAGGNAVTAQNVIGGIGSITQLTVSGVSTFVGLSTFKNNIYVAGVSTFVGLSTFYSNVFIDQSLFIKGDLFINSLNASQSLTVGNVVVTGIATIANLHIGTWNSNGVAFFNGFGTMRSSNSPTSPINYTNNILTTNDINVPTWSSTIDGGTY